MVSMRHLSGVPPQDAMGLIAAGPRRSTSTILELAVIAMVNTTAILKVAEKYRGTFV